MSLYSPTRNRGQYKRNVTLNLIKNLARGKVVTGTMFREFTYLNRMIAEGGDPVEEIAKRGYDFLVIDCEHKAFNFETLAELSERAHELGIPIWIRPEQTSQPPISRYADIGFSGFMIPNVIYPREAKFIVNRAYFPPIAEPPKNEDKERRGFSLGPIPRDAQEFSNIRAGEIYINKNTIVVIQTEHPLGIDNLGDILSIRGVHGTIIGVNDLARGIAQQKRREDLLEFDFSAMYRHELMMKAYQAIGKICQDNKKYAGIHFTEVSEIDLVQKLVCEFGYRLVLLGRDENFDSDEFVKVVEQINR